MLLTKALSDSHSRTKNETNTTENVTFHHPDHQFDLIPPRRQDTPRGQPNTPKRTGIGPHKDRITPPSGQE